MTFQVNKGLWPFKISQEAPMNIVAPGKQTVTFLNSKSSLVLSLKETNTGYLTKYLKNVYPYLCVSSQQKTSHFLRSVCCPIFELQKPGILSFSWKLVEDQDWLENFDRKTIRFSDLYIKTGSWYWLDFSLRRQLQQLGMLHSWLWYL